MTFSAEELKRIACVAIDKVSEELNEVSQAIWKNPELSYNEIGAAKILCEFFERQGFPVERNHVLETGFRSVIGDVAKPNIAVLCEYDALPEVGHACGHNLIAEAGAGASVGIKAALDAAKVAGKSLGTLTVLGTPAEEEGGGKEDIIQAGSFKQVDVAMMCHPFPYNIPRPYVFAIASAKVTFAGKASHAAGFPWEGKNALDAAVMTYTGVSLMRQQMKPSWRIHGIITNGGAKPNIIPEESCMSYYIRTLSLTELPVLKKKFAACVEASAAATDCKVEIKWGSEFADVVTNESTILLYESNFKALGGAICTDKAVLDKPMGSTDMGNVSRIVPGIHPMFAIGCGAGIHTREFAKNAGSVESQVPTILQAKALAMTAIDLYCNPDTVATCREDLKKYLANESA